MAYFDSVIRAMTDTGLFTKLGQKVVPTLSMKGQETVEEEKLNLEHFVISFIICTIGLLTSCIVAIKEVELARKSLV